jgi:cytochrome c biogenesis protein CcdA
MAETVISDNLNTTVEKGKKWRSAFFNYGLPFFVVALFLSFLIAVQNRAETAVADLASWLPVGFAFAAGMVASVNPCGFLLLPSYISFYLGTEEKGFYEQKATTRFFKALALGGTATGGFIIILIVFGGAIAAGGQWLVGVFPYAGVIIGAAMAALGLWLMISHRTIGILAAGRVTVSRKRNLGNAFLFGIVYAIGSLSCTLPIFLVVVGSAAASQGLASSILQFMGYAFGMGTILIAVTVGAALFRGVVAKWLKRLVPYVHRTSALFLLGAGAYLVYYWLFITGSFF